MHNVKQPTSNWQQGKFLATQSERHQNVTEYKLKAKKELLKKPKLVDYGNVSDSEEDVSYSIAPSQNLLN